MKHSTGKPTKAEAARMARLKGMWCIACFHTPHVTPGYRTPEVHHLLSGNRRRGHMFTIPLCPWHHRGEHYDYGPKDMEQVHGPSLARTSKKFREAFGSDDELLELTNKQLGEMT